MASAIKEALKTGDEVSLRALRMLRTELRYRQDQLRRPLRPEDELACVRAAIQRRAEAAAQYRAAGREDLARAEEAEAEVLKKYMPQGLSAQELASLVEEVIQTLGAQGPKDFGRVMKEVMAKVAGRAEGGTVSQMVRERLNALA